MKLRIILSQGKRSDATERRVKINVAVFLWGRVLERGGGFLANESHVMTLHRSFVISK